MVAAVALAGRRVHGDPPRRRRSLHQRGQHAYAFDDAGEIELTAREDKQGLRRHVVIDVLDRGRSQDIPDVGANGMAIMRGLMHRVNVQVRPDGTRVSLISCAVPQRPTSSRSRSKGVHTVERDRVEFALDEAAAHCIGRGSSSAARGPSCRPVGFAVRRMPPFRAERGRSRWATQCA